MEECVFGDSSAVKPVFDESEEFISIRHQSRFVLVDELIFLKRFDCLKSVARLDFWTSAAIQKLECLRDEFDVP